MCFTKQPQTNGCIHKDQPSQFSVQPCVNWTPEMNSQCAQYATTNSEAKFHLQSRRLSVSLQMTVLFFYFRMQIPRRGNFVLPRFHYFGFFVSLFSKSWRQMPDLPRPGYRQGHRGPRVVPIFGIGPARRSPSPLSHLRAFAARADPVSREAHVICRRTRPPLCSEHRNVFERA